MLANRKKHLNDEWYFDWAAIGISSNNGGASHVRGCQKHEIASLLTNVLLATATEINCNVERLVLTDSTTQGLDVALDGLLSHQPEIVVVTDCAHPTTQGSASRFVHKLNRLGLATCSLATIETSSLRMSSSPAEWARTFCERLAKLVGRRGAVLVLEHVDCIYGMRAPLGRVHVKLRLDFPEVSVVFDGAQAAGLFHWRVPPNACYAGDYHKYFNGPAGTGFLVIPREAINLLPQWAWSRTIKGLSFTGEQTPTESHSRWRECLEALRQSSSENDRDRERKIWVLRDMLRDELKGTSVLWTSPKNNSIASSIVALTLPKGLDPILVTRELRSKGMFVKPTSIGLRVSLHHTLPPAAVSALAGSIKELLA